MKKKLFNIRDIITKNTSLSQISYKVSTLYKIEYCIKKNIPIHLHSHFKVINYRDDKIIIATDNASMLVLLRTFQQDLLNKLKMKSTLHHTKEIIFQIKPALFIKQTQEQ